MPDVDALMPVVLIAAPHPATQSVDVILSQTQNRFQRRSGPGGQHRNKTSSGVFLLHEPTGVSVEATERRSQADNRVVAATRLRYRLAIEVRSPSSMIPVGTQADLIEQRFRDSYRGTNLKLNDTNADKPAVLALLLNDLHVTGGQPSLVARHWSVSTSSILQLVKSQQSAFGWVNAVRLHHGRKLLK